MTTDLRATTWEDAAAKTFRFNSQNFIDEKLKTSVDGRAERAGPRVGVNLNKPAAKKFGLDQNGIFFPTDHMRRIILAARAGQTLLKVPVFDGSENGDKIYDTLSVIGAPIDPQTKKPDDAAAKDEVLVAYAPLAGHHQLFRADQRQAEKPGEQTPVYSISFELYENGISRALSLDYNDFVIAGEMTQLEIHPAKPAKTRLGSYPSVVLAVGQGDPPDDGFPAEFCAQRVDGVLAGSRLARMGVKQVVLVGGFRGLQAGHADADQAKFRAVDFLRQQFASAIENSTAQVGSDRRASGHGCGSESRRS